jgi:Raf kinase inhibitor-like YbhB/YbcL family protein
VKDVKKLLEKFDVLLIFLVFITLFVSCKSSAGDLQNTPAIDTGSKTPSSGEFSVKSVKIDLKLTSSAFKEGETIPVKYTGEGDDISPPLKWNKPPEGTKSFVIICDDPDAPMGVWDHWVLYNIKPSVTDLSEGVAKEADLPDGSIQGKNSSGKTGYNGPMPPKGKAHRYFFRIYALDTLLKLEAGVNKNSVIKAMEGHILAEGQLMGKYARK